MHSISSIYLSLLLSLITIAITTITSSQLYPFRWLFEHKQHVAFEQQLSLEEVSRQSGEDDSSRVLTFSLHFTSKLRKFIFKDN